MSALAGGAAPAGALVMSADAPRGARLALAPDVAARLPRHRSLELVCGDCGDWCDAAEIPEDHDPWCFSCGTLMEPAC